MKTIITLLAISATLLLAACQNQQGVRSSGSPHMTNKATGNAIIAVMIRDFDANQDAAKATEIDALKAAVTAAVSQAGEATNNGNADLTPPAPTPKPAQPPIDDTIPPPAANDLDAPAPPLTLDAKD